MIRSAITINLVPEAAGGPFLIQSDDLAAACLTAARYEFDAIELYVTDANAVPSTAVWHQLNTHGLKLAAVGTGAGWLQRKLTLTSDAAETRKGALDYLRAMIDFAGPFGAPIIIGSMQGRSQGTETRAAAIGYLEDALEELGEHAAKHRVPVLLEILNREESNLVNTAAEGVAFVGRLATKNVRLLADLYHLSMEENDVPAAIKTIDTLLGHLHFVDSNRRPAGGGSLDFGPVVAALTQIGYNGYASAEALPWPDAEAAARQTMTMYKKLFQGK
jgi:sugar phosphate isomerase/epimerase